MQGNQEKGYVFVKERVFKGETKCKGGKDSSKSMSQDAVLHNTTEFGEEICSFLNTQKEVLFL